MEKSCNCVEALEKRGYKFGRRIGKGSYGNVVEAKFLDPERKVSINLACKYVDKRKVPKEFLEKFFPRELHFYTILSHPNLIRVHSILQSGSSVFIFMRCAELGDLLSYVKRKGVVSEPQAKLWFHQMASAVRYLHSQQIAHRDLKCDNIFISQHLNVKIGDFGFARYCVHSTPGRDFYSETFCGSAAYAAPEVVCGEPYKPHLADIWSMGIVLSVMLFGVMPFDDTNTRRLVRAQKTRRITINHEIREKLSSDCLAVHKLCLEPEPKNRIDIDKLFDQPWLKMQLLRKMPRAV